MDAAGTGGTALQADGAAPRPLPLIAAGAAATGGAESVGGGGAVAVADGLLEPPASRLVSPWAKCSPISLFADASSLSTPAALQHSCKLSAVPTEMAQGKSQHQDAQLDLGRVRSIVVEHAVLETYTSSHSAAVDVFGVQERVASVRPISDRVPAVTATLYHCALRLCNMPVRRRRPVVHADGLGGEDSSCTVGWSRGLFSCRRYCLLRLAPFHHSNPLPPKPGWAVPYPHRLA